ncbi:hypothetical protein HU200_040912 [Digitaria exilis]|uniref:DUF1618 domain-containing protein n=1 Tax=Digitaria exilis TaxID=1010633 RepID=A0A835B9F3_9POAL|nr:hypothetical protein HU200_040912 [Digitaria exilis]
MVNRPRTKGMLGGERRAHNDDGYNDDNTHSGHIRTHHPRYWHLPQSFLSRDLGASLPLSPINPRVPGSPSPRKHTAAIASGHAHHLAFSPVAPTQTSAARVKMLGRRLALGCFDELSRIRWRHSIGLVRSMHLLTSNHGETQPGEHPAVSPATTGSRWVMLSTDDIRLSDTVADAKTVAESTTSRGRGFRISADMAAPPSSSFLCYHGEDYDDDPDALVAAHGDSVLFGLRHYPGNSPDLFEYFVYRAAAAGRPPYLSPPLPTHHFSWRFDEGPTHELHADTTGILRRGGQDGELLAVELGVRNQIGTPSSGRTIDLNVLRVGSAVVDIDGRRRDGLRQWTWPDRVIPVGHRFLCRVKYSDGFLLCDMADPNLMLRSMPLPVKPRDEDDDRHCWNMCALCGAAGADALRFPCLPCVQPSCPVVSPANSDIIFFKVSNRCLLGFDGKEKVWMLEVDTRRKVEQKPALNGTRDPRVKCHTHTRG